MACNCSPCSCCNRLLKSTAIAIVTTSDDDEDKKTPPVQTQTLQITIPTTTLDNLTNYCLILAQSLPAGSNVLPVTIKNGSDVFPLICKKGNNIHADQISCRNRYSCVYGNDPKHLQINNCLNRTAFTVS